MATITKQSQAQGSLNTLRTLLDQFRALGASVNDFVARYNGANWSAIWNAMPSTQANADGTFGTANRAPNNAHPIATRVVTAPGLASAANDAVQRSGHALCPASLPG
ncbi:MAG: hypothetical protein ACRESF_01945 [Pseudomonas sp.]